MPFLVFIKACAVELALAVSTDAAQLELGLWGSRPTFVAAGTVARLSQRVQMHVSVTHFLYSSQFWSEKGDVFWWRGFLVRARLLCLLFIVEGY